MYTDKDLSHYLKIPDSENRMSAFREIVLSFYKQYKKDYPWRKNITPYSVMVSEFMLQQTQGERAAPKYSKLLNRFPDIYSLAAASLADVLASWQGLGYNRRAGFLHKTAQAIVLNYKGVVPNNTEHLQSFPGIGYPTACAIRAYAYNAPVVYIETNIRTVFIYHFFQDKADISDKEIFPLVETALDKSNPSRWYSALMDYGVMLKKTMPNPGRRSRHYIKQSPFKGSRRELRGNIIKYLVQNSSGSIDNFCKFSERELEDVANVLDDLKTENIVAEENGIYTIK